jgi:replication factor C subunit 3/5
MFFTDKYTPLTVKDAFFHKELLNLLQIMSNDEEIPHIIFYGTEGTGKKSLIKLFLEMLFDKSVNKTKDTIYKITGSGNKKTDEIVKQSNYHIVIKPNNNNSDRYLIHDIVKEYAKRKSLGVFERNRNFKLVLINNIDNMSYYAQSSLRRTMERYNHNCRFVMWCRSLSKVIKPLQSRCICLRVPTPSDEKLFKHILNISIKENINVGLAKYSEIINKSKGNIKSALWELQFLKFNYDLDTNYNQSINEIVKLILEKKLVNVQIIRNILHSLMITNIDDTTILRDIIDNICLNNKFTDNLKQKIIQAGAIYENQLVKGRREIIQFDAFITSAVRFVFEEKQ